MQMRPNTSMAAVPGTDFSGLANLMAMKGRGGDNTLVHMSKSELPYLNLLAKSAGYPQGLPVNPETGLPEANILKSILPIAGTILGTMFLGPGIGMALGSKLAGTAIGAGLGSFGGSLLAGKSLKDAAIGGLISGGLSGLGAAAFGGGGAEAGFTPDPSGFTDPAAAQLAGREAAKASMTGVENFGNLGVAPGSGAAFGGVQTTAGLPEFGFGTDFSPFANTVEGGLNITGADFVPSGVDLQFPADAASKLNIPDAIAAAQSSVDPATEALLKQGVDPLNFPISTDGVGDALETFGTSDPFRGADAAARSAVSGYENLVQQEPLSRLAGFTKSISSAPSPALSKAAAMPRSISGITPSTAVPKSVTETQIVDALKAKDLVGKDFGVAGLREGYFPTQRSLESIQGMSEPSFLSTVQGYDKYGPLTRMDFLKTQLKPAATQAGVMLGIDAATGQGAFEPIDYSSFPQAGEDRRVSPFDTSGIRFASRRTGAFPRTEEEALAFAQPGGTRRRFFDQEFLTSAKTGGGLADLEVQRFFGGGETGGDDTGPGDADDPGDSGSSVGDDASDDGFDGSVGPDDMDDFGAVADAAVAAAIAEANEAATIPAAFRGNPEDDIEDDLFDVAMALPSPPTIPADTMDDFDRFGRSDIAQKLGGRALNPGLSRFGFQTKEGRGPFAGYFSEDKEMQEIDEQEGYGAKPTAVTTSLDTFSPLGFLEDVGKTALNVAVPGLGFGVDVAQQAGLPEGMGTIGAIQNIADEEGAIAKTKGGLLKMAKGGDIKDVLSFLSPAYGLGRAAKKGGMKGALSFLSPAFALSQGELPGPFNNLMSAQAGNTEQQAPAVRAAEAPTEQTVLPPTKEELEEMQNIATMQQVLAGVPVEAQAGGLISAYQMGGPPSPYFEGMVKGRGDGMSDSIPFTIEGTQPAILSRDEYVLPADIVSMMGNGSSDAGAEKIDTFINDFRVQKYGRGEQPPETRRGLSGVA